MERSNKEKFQEEGFVIINVLTEQEVNDFREVMYTLLSPQVKAANTKSMLPLFNTWETK